MCTVKLPTSTTLGRCQGFHRHENQNFWVAFAHMTLQVMVGKSGILQDWISFHTAETSSQRTRVPIHSSALLQMQLTPFSPKEDNSFRISTRENKHDLMMAEKKGHESHQVPREVSHNFMNTLDAFLQAQCSVYETNLSLFATYPVREGKGVGLYMAPASFQECSSIPEKPAQNKSPPTKMPEHLRPLPLPLEIFAVTTAILACFISVLVLPTPSRILTAINRAV